MKKLYPGEKDLVSLGNISMTKASYHTKENSKFHRGKSRGNTTILVSLMAKYCMSALCII